MLAFRVRLGQPAAVRLGYAQRTSLLSCRSLRQTNPLGFRGQTTEALKDRDENVYYGPLTPTFRRLKVFSLSSLALSSAFVPFIFLIESHLPLSARIALATTALATSGASTAIIAWCASPYVTTLRRIIPLEGSQGLEMTTLSLFLRERVTRVYDSAFLVDTPRFFAKWQLAETVPLPAERAGQDGVLPGQVETVAETLDAKGGVVGRWIVTWDEQGGRCREVGKVVRHFNVHDELLH